MCARSGHSSSQRHQYGRPVINPVVIIKLGGDKPWTSRAGTKNPIQWIGWHSLAAWETYVMSAAPYGTNNKSRIEVRDFTHQKGTTQSGTDNLCVQRDFAINRSRPVSERLELTANRRCERTREVWLMTYTKKKVSVDRAALERSIISSTKATMQIEGRLPERDLKVELGRARNSTLVQSIKSRRRVV